MSGINWGRVVLGGLVVFVVGGLSGAVFAFSGLADLVGYGDPFGDEIPMPSGGVAGIIAWSLAARRCQPPLRRLSWEPSEHDRAANVLFFRDPPVVLLSAESAACGRGRAMLVGLY